MTALFAGCASVQATLPQASTSAKSPSRLLRAFAAALEPPAIAGLDDVAGVSQPVELGRCYLGITE